MSSHQSVLLSWLPGTLLPHLTALKADHGTSTALLSAGPAHHHKNTLISKISQPKLWYAPHPRTAPNDDNDSQSKQSTAACMQTEACTALHNKQGFFNCAYYHLVTRHRALCLGSPASPANLMLILVHNRNCSGLTSDGSAQSRAACYMM